MAVPGGLQGGTPSGPGPSSPVSLCLLCAWRLASRGPGLVSASGRLQQEMKRQEERAGCRWGQVSLVSPCQSTPGRLPCLMEGFGPPRPTPGSSMVSSLRPPGPAGSSAQLIPGVHPPSVGPQPRPPRVHGLCGLCPTPLRFVHEFPEQTPLMHVGPHETPRTLTSV